MGSQKEVAEKQWETELVERINQIDQNNSGIKRMTKKDYIIAGVIVIICFCVVVAGAFISAESGNPAIESTEETGMETEVSDTGAWKKGILYFKDYEVVLSCPEAGHPSGESDWSTSYMDETKDIDVMVDFQFQDEQLDNKIKALKEDFVELFETELWEHEMVCYIADYEYEFNENETKLAECLVAMMPMEDGTYIQIEITGMRKELLDAGALLIDERFQKAFMIEISKQG